MTWWRSKWYRIIPKVFLINWNYNRAKWFFAKWTRSEKTIVNNCVSSSYFKYNFFQKPRKVVSIFWWLGCCWAVLCRVTPDIRLISSYAACFSGIQLCGRIGGDIQPDSRIITKIQLIRRVDKLILEKKYPREISYIYYFTIQN